MAYVNPTVANFKAYFQRDFPYNADASLGVTDFDIQKAIDACALVIPQDLFYSQSFYTMCFLYLTAHLMVLSISTSSQGLSGKYEWAIASKSAGNVSIGLSIPEDLVKNPQFAMLTKTTYGATYFEYIYPYIIGPTFVVQGITHP